MKLRRALHPSDAISLVVGTIIGTGIFLKTATMSQLVGTPLLVLAAWAVAGFLSFLGAIVYAELGERFPEAGGEYVYLRAAYGDLPAFLYGWQRFWISSPGSIAAYASGAATFLSGLTPLSNFGRIGCAMGFIVGFSLLNCLSVSVGGRAQTFLTGLKVSLVIGLSLAILSFSQGASVSHLGEIGAAGFSWSGFGLAVLAALWAFDGWNNLPMAAGEVEDPARTIPISLLLGVVVVFAIYALANIAYFYALPFSTVLTANSRLFPTAAPVATIAASTVFGASGAAILAGAMVISALGAMNGSILTGSRVPYAMAQDGVFPRIFGRLSSGGFVPVFAVLVQGGLACVLALSGTFDQLTDWVVFASWIFYALCGLAVILFRRRIGVAGLRYRIPFGQLFPSLFCLLALLLLLNTLWSSPRESAMGVAFILAGVPFYFFRRRKNFI